jgi:two-component system CheB/CheR fusion protein
MSPRPRVLIVDPRQAARQALAALLPAGEAEHAFASTAEEALAALRAGGVALAILELDEPALDGYAAAATLRGDEHGRELPLLLLTRAGFDPARIFAGFELGAVGLLSQPLDPRLLDAKVRTFLRLTRQRLELAESEARFRQTFENAAVGIAHIDFTGQFLRVNEAFCRFVGYERDALIGRRFGEITHPDDVAEDIAFARRLHDGELESFVREKRYVRPDGAIAWAVVTVSRAVEPTTGRSYAIAMVVDEAARRLAEQSRRELVSFVSHDLKSPLTALALQVGLARRAVAAGAGGEERLAHALAQIDRQVGRMGKLLDELLDAARLRERRPLDLAPAAMDLVALVRPLVEELQTNAPRHRVELTIEQPSLIGSWDARRLERVVQNLLSNAAKYSPAGGSVRVSLAREPGASGAPGVAAWAVLRVADEGVGIPAADRSRIFDWFARGANVTGSRIEGSGIGLAAVRAIVEQHGGSVSLDSEEGRGSTFTVRLPMAAAS